MSDLPSSLYRSLAGMAARYPWVTRSLLAAVFLIGTVVGTALLISFLVEGGTSKGAEVLFQACVSLAFLALWILLYIGFGSRQASPVQAFWHALVIGLVCAAVSAAVLQFLPIGLTPDGIPLTIPAAISAAVLSTVAAAFSFFLLLRFRDLVLYRRTRKSLLIWRLMVGGIVAATLLTVVLDSVSAGWGSLSRPQWSDTVPVVIIVALMALNCLRLSWVVRLSFRDKAVTMMLSLLLLTLLSVVPITLPNIGLAFGSGGIVNESLANASYFAFLDAYSGGLADFVRLVGLFGILYSLTAILSLLFHLPTTGDFQRRTDEMAAMQSLASLVKEVFDPAKLLKTIAASPIEAGSAAASWLAIGDHESGTLEPSIAAAERIGPETLSRIDTSALYREVARKGDPILLQQAQSDRRVGVTSRDGIGSLLAVPLSARKRVLGVLFVTKETANGFEKDDVETVSMYATQAALALENARLFEEQVSNERQARELAIAREVQQKLMPQRAPALNGLSAAASSISAYEVGGDYYDYAELPDGRLAFIVADVSGKGTSAAFYMAELRGAFNSLVLIAPEPRELLCHMNRSLGSSLERNVFITAVYGLLDVHSAELTLARAGHCPAATVSRNGEGRFIRTRGLGLGLDRTGKFEQTLEVERVYLREGDIIALFTDGLAEARNGQGAEYGYDRCLAVLQEHRQEEASSIRDALLTDIDHFVEQGSTYGDDLTLLVIKWQNASGKAQAP